MNMELRLNISYPELLDIIQSLPPEELRKLVQDIKGILSTENSKYSNESFQHFLIDGPTMSEEDYEQFLNRRNWLNKWRHK